MLPSALASSNSISRPSPLRATWLTLRVIAASWRAMLAERLRLGGLLGYLAVWIIQPVFQIAITALIYRGHPDLLRYAVVALSADSFVFSAIYFVGEILDRERVKGTLVGLFLAPCPRFAWLSGFALVGLVETTLSASAGLAFGYGVLGVRFDPDWPALALTFVLFLASLWGMGLIFSGIGLYLKKSNSFSNLVSPIVMVLGGAYYPVALLPTWLRYPARALPFGYGLQALADAALYHATIRDLAGQLLPLAGFALALPVAGVLAFGWVERLVRERGELDLY
ncbi:MAG TPA: ABC transporter permease [Thermomicrobiales bacterium]|nr:ABC transporter permease [Thermomicrobiales bacterium]